MPIWTTLPVDEQPDLTLTEWQVRELPDGELHLVGHCLENREGRVSSRIATFDREQLVAVSATGRRYALSGRPSFNRDAEYVWNRWAAVNGVSAFKDISRSIWEVSKPGQQATERRAASWPKVDK